MHAHIKTTRGQTGWVNLLNYSLSKRVANPSASDHVSLLNTLLSRRWSKLLVHPTTDALQRTLCAFNNTWIQDNWLLKEWYSQYAAYHRRDSRQLTPKFVRKFTKFIQDYDLGSKRIPRWMRYNAHCAKMHELKNQDSWFLNMVLAARCKPIYTFW